MTVRRLIRIVRGAVSTLLLLAVAYAVLPARFGGRTTFVVVQGASMEPRYHSGDLLYARSGGRPYAAGDVVVYRIPAGEAGAGRLIVHRLQQPSTDVVGHVTGWVVKGDNRRTADATHPTDADIVARPVLDLGPNATRFLLLIPLLFAAATAVLVGWMLWPDPLPVEVAPPDGADGDRPAVRDQPATPVLVASRHRDDLYEALAELDLAEADRAAVDA